MDDNKIIKRRMIVTLAVFILLLIACFILIYFVSKKQSSLEGADSSIRLSAQSGFPCEYAEAQKLYPFGDGVMKVTVDRVAYLTSSGNEVYSYLVNYNNPFCVVKGQYALVGDLNGYSFSIYDIETQIYTKATNGKISSAELSQDCFVSLILSSDEGYGQVSVFDPQGGFVADWISNDSGYPIATKFNNDSSRLAITTVNTNGAVLEPYIKLLSIERDKDRYEAFDYAVFSVDNETFVSSICFCKDRFITFSSDCAYIIKDDKLTQLNIDYDSLSYAFNVGNNLFVIYSDGVGQVNKLSVIDDENSVLYDSLLGNSINAYGISGEKCVISVDRRLFVYNSNGNILSDISVDEDVLKVGFIGSDKVIVVSTSGVHTYNY